MKQYLIPEQGHFYKANMHMHTTVSDGRMTPEETKEEYLKRGYSIVAFTDHQVLLPHNDLTDERFLAITSTEIDFNQTGNTYNFLKTYHLNLYSRDPNQTRYTAFTAKAVKHPEFAPADMLDYNYPKDYDIELINRTIAKAREEGFFVSYNHPVWSTQTYADYIGLKGLWGVECHNTGCERTGYPDTPQPLDDLLRTGAQVFPLATDDAHNMGHCFGGWLMVKAEKLEYATVINALERGDFYASTGPEIKELSIEDGVLHVECSAARSVFVSTERRMSMQKNATDAPLCAADFDLNKYLCDSKNDKATVKPYFRVTVVDEAGKRAYSRAYFLDELN